MHHNVPEQLSSVYVVFQRRILAIKPNQTVIYKRLLNVELEYEKINAHYVVKIVLPIGTNS